MIFSGLLASCVPGWHLLKLSVKLIVDSALVSCDSFSRLTSHGI